MTPAKTKTAIVLRLHNRGNEPEAKLVKDIQPLIEQLDSDGEKIPRQAIQRLKDIGRPVRIHLLEAAKSPRTRLRRWAMEALAEIGGPGVREVIRNGIRDEAMSVRLHALKAVLKMRDPGAKLLLTQLLSDPSGGIRINALAGLSQLNAKKSISAIRGCLKDPKDYVRRQARITLAALGEEVKGTK